MYNTSHYIIVNWSLVHPMSKEKDFELVTIATIRNERGTTWIVQVKEKKTESRKK